MSLSSEFVSHVCLPCLSLVSLSPMCLAFVSVFRVFVFLVFVSHASVSHVCLSCLCLPHLALSCLCLLCTSRCCSSKVLASCFSLQCCSSNSCSLKVETAVRHSHLTQAPWSTLLSCADLCSISCLMLMSCLSSSSLWAKVQSTGWEQLWSFCARA